MNYFNDRNPWSGVAVLADYQFAGVGRKNNEWVSPKGSLSLTFGFDLDFVKGIWLNFEFSSYIKIRPGIVTFVYKITFVYSHVCVQLFSAICTQT